jgi:branched-chain amino acid transport system ATP-binding protein
MSLATPDPVPAEDELRISGVTKRYAGVLAVSDVSFALPKNGILGLIGPNGAGKSTMVSMISGFTRPSAGQITFGHHDLTRLKPFQIAQLGISRNFQQATPLMGLTVIENVMVGMHVRYHASLGSVLLRLPSMRREAATVAQAALDLLTEFGLASVAESDAGSLTFGQLRFLEIARALAMQPRLLLLDEPAAGLNKVETARLADLIRQVHAKGIRVLLIDHDVPFVFDLCDEVAVMNFGNLIAFGPARDVYQNPAVREAYLGTDTPNVAKEGEAQCS